MTQLRTNYEQGVRVAQGLVGLLHRREFPFDMEDLSNLFPDSAVPQGISPGSKQHILYLFCTCVLDSGVLAEVVYDSMTSLARAEDLSELQKLNEGELIKKLVPHFKSLGDPEKAISLPGKTLHYNLKKLQEEYQGDPRLIMGASVEETIENIMFGKTGSNHPAQKFKRYGNGTATLFMKNAVRFGAWDFSPYELFVKIDRHMQRISLGTGVVESDEQITRGRLDKLIAVLTPLYRQICMDEKISAIELCDAKWAVGHHKCMKNDDVYCMTTCPIQCYSRPILEAHKRDKANSRPVYYIPKSEMRRNMNNLFRWARDKN